MTVRVLIDCDPGIDDALALYALLASAQASVQGVTTVFGNVTVKQATRNLGRLLSLLVPPRGMRIGEGSSDPLIGSRLPRRSVHGHDGLGDLHLPLAPASHPLLDSTSLISDLLKQGRVDTIVALGPLTNLARAFASGPSLFRRLQSVVVMGGTMQAESAPGEFNVASDPAAARCLLGSSMPLRWVPLEVAVGVVFREEEIERFRQEHGSGDIARVIVGLLSYLARVPRHGDGAAAPDAVAAALALDPTLGRWRLRRLAVEPRIRSGRLRVEAGVPNAQLCEAIDAERVRDVLWESWTKLVDAAHSRRRD